MARWRKSSDAEPKKPSRLSQMRQTYRMTRKVDRWVGAYIAATFLGILAAFVLLGVFFPPMWLWAPFGVMFGILAALIVFGRRAESAAYASLEGQPGAAMSALTTLRKGWKTTPTIAVTRQQDLVHRVTGRAGIVLVGEGSSNRLRPLLSQERKKHSRVAADVAIHEIIVGTEEGQVPLRRLNATIMKLPKTASGSEIAEINRRLRALPSQALPIPKGPLPKGLKLPKGGLPR